MLKICVICQAIDEKDTRTSILVQWVRALARVNDVESVQVITLRTGEFSLPGNVAVHEVVKGNRFVKLFNFYQIVFRVLRKPLDCFLIFKGGLYPILLFPFKLFRNIPIYQWKTHPYISPQMHICARWCDSKVFTASKSSFPLNLPNVKVIGHGIDTGRFCISSNDRTELLVTIGRIAPSKKIEKILHALSLCRSTFGKSYTLDIFGPVLEKDRDYKHYLDTLIQQLNLSSLVSFRGDIFYEEVPEVLNHYKLFINFSETALDKAVLEAFACGLPVLSTNSCVAEVIPVEWRSYFIVSPMNQEAQARQIDTLLSFNSEWFEKVGNILRQIVVEHHSLDTFFSKMIGEMK